MQHPELHNETVRRRTFAIISHPDAGKTTLTEQLLLYGGAIRQAGYEAGLYASEGYARFDLDTEAVKYLPFWMASYTVENRLPAHIHTYSVWQQTDSTYAGGVDGAFDLNIILPS